MYDVRYHSQFHTEGRQVPYVGIHVLTLANGLCHGTRKFLDGEERQFEHAIMTAVPTSAVKAGLCGCQPPT